MGNKQTPSVKPSADVEKAFEKAELDLLGQIFADLASRSPGTTSVDKSTFRSFFQLPGIMSELLFNVFDKVWPARS
jgi:hypothetical protein